MGVPKIGIQPSTSCSAGSIVVRIARREDDDPPEAEDHARDRGEQLDERADDRADAAGREQAQVDADRDPERHREHQRDRRGDDRAVRSARRRRTRSSCARRPTVAGFQIVCQRKAMPELRDRGRGPSTSLSMIRTISASGRERCRHREAEQQAVAEAVGEAASR